MARGDRSGLLEAAPAGEHGPARAAVERPPGPDRLAELRVPIPDRQGMLAEFTGLAGDLGINIYDLTIAHSAEGPRGVLTLLVAPRTRPTGSARRSRSAATPAQ